jgi:hypothetical protein
MSLLLTKQDQQSELLAISIVRMMDGRTIRQAKDIMQRVNFYLESTSQVQGSSSAALDARMSLVMDAEIVE